MLRGQGRPVRPQRRLDGPVHDRRLRQRRHLVVRQAQAGRAASTARRSLIPRPQPELRRERRTQAGARELPGQVRVRRQRERGRHLRTRSRRASTTRRRPTVPPQFLRKYSTDSGLKSRFHQNSGDRTWYLTMNLTQPPFDDVHVRRAMNWVMDKQALVQAWGGPLIGEVANHIIPDSLLGNLLAEYAPYETPRDKGSVAKAKAALKGSKYDTGKNGTCSAKECKNVLLIVDTRAAGPEDARGDPARTRRRSASPSRPARSRVRTRRSRTCRRTSRSPSGPAGVRTTPIRTRSSARCSTAGRSSRPATRTTRSSASRRSSAPKLKVKGNCQNVPSRQRRPRPVRQPRRRGPRRLLRGARPEADDAGRAVGPVPVVEGDAHHEQERDQVRVRPVLHARPPTSHMAVN